MELDYRWNGNYVNMKDYETGVAALHEKLWRSGPPEKLRGLWQDSKERMEAHHMSQTIDPILN
jgi:hypothetical protein